MLNLNDANSDLYQLLKQINYQPSELHSGRLKHICLPQCNNKQARAAFESALYGVFSEFEYDIRFLGDRRVSQRSKHSVDHIKEIKGN